MSAETEVRRFEASRLVSGPVVRWILPPVCAFLGAVSAGVIAFSMTPVYRATVLLAPAIDTETSSLSRSLGGLSSVASVLGAAAGSEQFNRNVAMLRSRRFCETFLDDEDIATQLRVDMERDAGLVSRMLASRGAPPSVGQLCQFFDRRIRTISVDPRTSFVTLSIRHVERDLVADWANQLVREVNEELRRRTIAEAEENLEFLELELSRATAVEVRQAISRTMESKIQSKALAATRPDFAFSIIDPASLPDESQYDSPRPFLMIAAGGMLGFALGFLVVWWGRGGLRWSRQ